MEKQYTELLAVLNSLVALHRDLMKVEQEKLSLIIDQDWKTLELRIDESKSILNKIEECERKRLSLIERIGGNRDLALSEILQGIPDDRRQVLKDRGEELQSVLLELKSLRLSILRYRFFQVQDQARRPTAARVEKRLTLANTPLWYST